jgi:hypothetical protein
VEEIRDQDDGPSSVKVEGTSPKTEGQQVSHHHAQGSGSNFERTRSEEVGKVNCYGQEVESMETPESKDLGSQTPQALTFSDEMSEMKDEQTPG